MSSTVALGSGIYRAASLRQVWLRRLATVGQSLWQVLEEVGRRRASAHLRQIAALRQATQPELAAALRRAASSQG